MRIAAFVLLMCSVSHVMGQTAAPNVAGKKTKEVRTMTRNAVRLGDTYTALLYCAEWVKRTPDNMKAAFQMAELHRQSRNYSEAEVWYAKVIKADAEQFPVALYHIGDMQLSQGKVEEATKNFNLFKKVAKNVKDDSYKKLVANRLLSCAYVVAMKDSNRTALTANLGNTINGPHIEFSPIPMGDTALVYGALREDEVKYYDLETFDSLNIPMRKLYLAVKKGDTWEGAGELPGPFNAMGAHIGNATMSEDGERIYFTICQRNWQMKTICELYYADWKRAGWKEPVKMDDEINLSNYTSTQPTLGRESKKNNEVLYFVSDRPKSKGGLDIWYTEYNKKKDAWSPPRNAGSKVNTAGMECTPNYDVSTHTLYFSSDGHPGFGGLDVLKSVGEKSKWEDPINLKKDINSPADDIDFVLSPNRESGFLVSNRKGGTSLLHETCCDDLYEFRYLEHVSILANVKLRSEDDCLTGTEFFVYIIDPETNERYLAEQKQLEDCSYSLKLEQGHNYRIEGKKDGHWTNGIDLSTKNVKDSKTYTPEIRLDKIPDKPMVLDGILYDFNSAELTKDAKNTIDTTLLLIMQRNPDIIIEIGSHTDSKGKDDYNLKLSQKRAQSVIDYLATQGIGNNRLQATGYGESKPIAPNENADGTDNPDGRTLNRRTEFQIVGKVDLEELQD